MSLHDQDDPALREAQEARLRKVWEPPKGLFLRWTDTNNNRVGVWYVLTAFGFMLFAGVLALIMRMQLAVPDNDFVDAGTFNQLFTLHGSVMMFLFAVPMSRRSRSSCCPSFWARATCRSRAFPPSDTGRS